MANELQSLLDIQRDSTLNPAAQKRLAELQAEGSTGSPDGSYAQQGQFLERQYLTEQGLLNRNTKQYNAAIAPAVKSYQDTIPELKQTFNTERDRLSGESGRLQQRYDALIGDITNRGQQAENMQTKTTNAELARRGITGSSGVAQQEITSAVLPIKQNYTSQIQQTGLEREDQMAKIRDLITGLTGQETDATRSIVQAIANLQSGAGQQAVGATQTDLRNRITDELAKSQLALQQRAADLAEKQYNQITLPSAQTQNQIASSLGGLAKAFGF